MQLSVVFSYNKCIKLPDLTLPPEEITLDDMAIDDMTINKLKEINSGNIEIISSPTTGITREINGIFSSIKIVSKEDALRALLNVRGIFQISDDYSFCCIEIDKDRIDLQVFTFNQLYKGIIVDGATFRVVAMKDGTPTSVSGVYQCISDTNVVPEISSELALETVPLSRNAHVVALYLVVYVDKNDRSHLCWKYETCSNWLTEHNIYYVDAHDGSLIDSVSTVVN